MIRKALRLIVIAIQLSAVATVVNGEVPFPDCLPCDKVVGLQK